MNLTQLIDIKERIAIGEDLTDAQRSFVLDCINEATGLGSSTTIVAKTTNHLARIDHIWAFLSVDEDGEGVCAAPLAPGMLTVPMIAADEARLNSLKPLARKMAPVFGKIVKLVKFTTREEIEEYQPGPT
jgi:hypothetical protein